MAAIKSPAIKDRAGKSLKAGDPVILTPMFGKIAAVAENGSLTCETADGKKKTLAPNEVLKFALPSS